MVRTYDQILLQMILRKQTRVLTLRMVLRPSPKLRQLQPVPICVARIPNSRVRVSIIASLVQHVFSVSPMLILVVLSILRCRVIIIQVGFSTMYQILKHPYPPTANSEIVPCDTFCDYLLKTIRRHNERNSVHVIQILLNIVLFYKEMNAYV